jgi:hypothetical protein
MTCHPVNVDLNLNLNDTFDVLVDNETPRIDEWSNFFPLITPLNAPAVDNASRSKQDDLSTSMLEVALRFTFTSMSTSTNGRWI